MQRASTPFRAGRIGLVLLCASWCSHPGTLASAPAPEPVRAVVLAAVENLYVRPDETSPVDDQAILGDVVDVLEETAGFARIRTASGEMAWIPERSIRRDPPASTLPAVDVSSNLAHVYRSPDVTDARPLLSAPLGARLAVEAEIPRDGHTWLRIVLPDGRRGFVQKTDVAPVSAVPAVAGAAPAGPASWLAMGKRFLGVPYTWGGTTPLGFDCSGLVWRVLERHGVILKRNASEMCFREPKLVAVPFDRLQAGDLVFFGTEDKVDHMGFWAGDGAVLEATAYGVPSTKVTDFATGERMKPRFRYARRLATLPGAPKPGPLSATRRDALEKKLSALAASGGATYGIFFKDLGGGTPIAIDATRTMHAASTMKTPVMLEVLRRVDAGTLKLDDLLEVKNEFRSLVDDSPFSIGLDPETDGPTMERLGGKALLSFLVTEMIVRSSNLAANLVLSLVGPANVQRFTDALGAATVRVRRCVEDSKAYDKGLNNETDAAGMGALMEAAFRSPKLSAAARSKAWEILTGQTFNEQIPAGIPKQAGAVVAHKTGSISTVQHDAAIVRLPDGRAYVLVLLANDFGATEEGRKRVVETTTRMSRAVWDAMIAPDGRESGRETATRSPRPTSP